MLRRTRLCGGLILALTVFAGMAVAGQSTTPPNWAQVDRTAAWICPTPSGTTGGWFTIPEFPGSITTMGGPVRLSITLTWVGYDPRSAWWLSPVIDSQRQPERLDWQTCCGGEVDSVNFERIYQLSAGQHSFAVALRCQNTLEVLRGWLTLYELPSTRR
jgi:hypothetical protein